MTLALPTIGTHVTLHGSAFVTGTLQEVLSDSPTLQP